MKKAKHLLKMVVKVYKERGLISLIRRIFQYLKEFAASLFFTSGDVLYISGCPGSSRFYRCFNQAEELKLYGLKSKIVSQDNLNLLKLTGKFNIFIFQRVIYNEHIKNTINSIKKQKKPIIFETDDLVFDPRYIPLMHYYNFFGDEEKSWYQNGIGREILKDAYVKNCIVSTDFLARALKQKYPNKNIFISYNKLNRKQVSQARKALAKKNEIKLNDGKIRIGYFSGSRSHDNDFETISNVLLEILKENKDAVLMTVGHLDINGKLGEVRSQIEKFDFVPLKKLPELMLKADINIVPLEIDNPFCQAKSALKYFEAGLLEIPTVATATDSFRKFIKNGESGFLAENENDWRDYVGKLIKDERLRVKIGREAREDSLREHTTQKIHPGTKKLAEFIGEELKNLADRNKDKKKNTKKVNKKQR